MSLNLTNKALILVGPWLIFLSLLHQIASAQAVPDAPRIWPTKIPRPGPKISREDIQLYYQIGLVGQRDLPWAPSPRSGFEMTLLRILAFAPQSVAPQSTTTQSTTPLSWHTLLKNCHSTARLKF